MPTPSHSLRRVATLRRPKKSAVPSKQQCISEIARLLERLPHEVAFSIFKIVEHLAGERGVEGSAQ